MAETVIALYDNLPEALDVAHALMDRGIARTDVSIIPRQERAHAPALASGWTSRILAVPGIGPVLGVGPLAAALAGMSGEVAGEGLLRALREHGVPPHEAPVYTEGVRRGGALIAVETGEWAVQAREVMSRHAPVDLEAYAARWRQEGWIGFDPEAGPYLTPKPAREHEAGGGALGRGVRRRR
jgi:hypothetical protein